MKKIILAITVMIICAASAFPAFAVFENPPITDEAAYLTENQLDELSEQLEEIRKQYNFDVAIYTENVMSAAVRTEYSCMCPQIRESIGLQYTAAARASLMITGLLIWKIRFCRI